MEFFSTFGGNPVASAAGLAVLKVVEEENLQERALLVGNYLKELLLALQREYSIIGDVRGSGLFLGVDLVSDSVNRSAATAQAAYVVNRLRECGVLTGTDGPFNNVIKLRPPLIISERDVDVFIEIFRRVLSEDFARHV